MYHMVQIADRQEATMKRQIIDHTAVTTASPTFVFDRLIDPPSWPQWSGHASGQVLTEADVPGGVGEVREFRIKRLVNVERVVESARPRRFSYVLESGLPLRDYRADVDIEPVAGGTRIRWHSEFSGANRLMGAVYRRGLGRFIAKLVRSLADQAAADQAAAAAHGSDDDASDDDASTEAALDHQ
jgi:hypothetical protein